MDVVIYIGDVPANTYIIIILVMAAVVCIAHRYWHSMKFDNHANIYHEDLCRAT